MTARRQTRHRPAFRPGTAARTGLLVALGLGLVSVGVVTYFVVTSPGQSKAGDGVLSEPAPPAPDAGSLRTQPGRAAVGIGTGKGLSVQIAQRNDPTRLAGTITSRTLEPLEGNRYSAERPESFIFMRDGRTIYIRADSARLYIPRSNEQPESGTLIGHVEISLFDRIAGGVDPSRDTPMFKFETDRFAFDLTAWEFEAPGEFRVRGPTVNYLASQLTLVLNQSDERVELLRVVKSKELRILSAPRGEGPAGATRTASAGSPNAPSAPGTAAPPGTGTPGGPAQDEVASGDTEPARHTYYHGVLTDEVHVARGESSIDSDKLDLWAHLVNGKLPEGAIAPLEEEKPRPGAQTAPNGSRQAQSSAPPPTRSAAKDNASAGPNAQDEPDAVITWNGPLEMRPVNDLPGELARDDVSVRFSTASDRPVRFAETPQPGRGIAGTATSVQYGATSRSLALAGADGKSLSIDLGRSGTLVSDRLDLDMGAGLAVVESAGSVAGIVRTGLESEDPSVTDVQSRVVRWSRRAEFRFTSEKGTSGAALLSAAMFGDVHATDGASTLRGDALDASFFEVRSKSGPISRLVVTGESALEDGRGAGLFSERLDVAFAQREGNPERSDPRLVTATGSALASRGDEFLAAEMIETALELDADGHTQVGDMLARGGATYQGKDGVWAESPEIRASATKQIATLSGEGSRVGKEGSSVLGSEIELDGQARLATVFSAGEFSHRGQNADGHAVNADASWSRSMTFNDRTGVLEARGDIHATLRPDERTVRQLEGATALINLTPNADSSGLDLTTPTQKAGDAEPRRVLRAEIVGASIDEDAGGRASITSRTYETADVPDGSRLAEELRVEGDRIIADDDAGTVEIPGAGVLRVVDVRAAPSGDDGLRDAKDAKDLTTRGAARFEWDGSLLLRREDGTVTMRQRVRMRHLGIDRAEMTELEAEEIVAHLTDLREDGTGGGVRGRLVRASASGAVWARAGQKELTADRLEYLTTERLIRAASNDGNDVVMLDPTRATPVRAKLLEWDLARDRIDVRQPGTIVIPR